LSCAATVRPWQALEREAYGITEERAQQEVLWIGQDGTVVGGSDAISLALRARRGRSRFLGLVIAAPVIRTIAAIAYRAWHGIATGCRAAPPPVQSRAATSPGHDLGDFGVMALKTPRSSGATTPAPEPKPTTIVAVVTTPKPPTAVVNAP
jgi:hypothetical protein